MNDKDQRYHNKSILAFGSCLGMIILVLILILTLTSCITVYTVTFEDGTYEVFKERHNALECHDRNNYQNPLSVEIDSMKSFRWLNNPGDIILD